MPFTPSHVMAVLPAFRVKWLDATALAVGAMVPDFQYFIYARREGVFSHSLLGIPTFCLPIALVVTIVWHARIKWLVLDTVPRAIARRPHAWVPRWPAIVVSALIGIATHLVWDNFTHADTIAVDSIAWLRTPATVPVLGRIPMHRVLQHASTAIGLIVVVCAAIVALWRAPRPIETSIGSWRTRLVWLGATTVIFAAVGARLVLKYGLEVGDLVAAGISAILGGALVAAVIFRRRLAEIRAAERALDPM